MTQQKDVQELLKLKSFFAAERQQMNALQAPDDFTAQIQKLAADYALREQATVTSLPPVGSDAHIAPPDAHIAPPDAHIAPPDAHIAPPATAALSALRQLKPRFRQRKSRLSPAMAAAVAMAALIICAITLTLPSDSGLPAGFAGLVEVKAAYAAGNGIDVNEGFIISASEPLPPELVEKALNVYPAFDYQLQQEDDATYRVLPMEPLAQNTVYHLSFDPERAQEDKPERAEYSWSFQTEADLELLECAPADTARDVPVAAALTLTFNKEITGQAVDFVSLEPQVEGEWRVEGANLHFVPAAGWADDTVYTLTLAVGLPAVDGTTLTQGRVSRFHTEHVAKFEFSLAAWETAGKTFTPQEIPSFLLAEQLESDGSPYLASLRLLPDSYSYAAALVAQGSEQAVIDTTELELLAEYELLPLDEEQGYRLALPESLPAGFYVLDLSKQGHGHQLLFQVSSLSAYVALGANDSLFWLHDGAGRPVYDALVTLWPQGPERGRSDMNGVALLTASQQKNRLLLYCIDTEQESLVLRLDNSSRQKQPLPRPAWALYTAQSQYQAGDTVDFFGVCELQAPDPSETPAETEVSRLTLRLKAMGANQAALPYTLELSGGAFSGSLTLPGLRPGWYELALYDEDAYVGGSFIQVLSSAEPLWQPLSQAEDEAGLPYDAGVTALATALSSDSWQIKLTPYSLSLPEGAFEAERGEFSGEMSIEATLLRQEQNPEALDEEPIITEEQYFTWELSGSDTFLATVSATRPGIYSLLLTGADSAGQPFELALPLSAREADPLLLQDAYSARKQQPHAYAGGEAVELGLYRGSAPLPPTGAGNSLFVLAGEHILAQQVTEATTAAMPTQYAYPAVFKSWGVYYQDGRYYESAPLILAGEQPPPAVLRAEWQPAGEAEDGSVLVSLRLSKPDGQPLDATLNLNLLAQAPAQEDNFSAVLNEARPCLAYQHFSRAENSAAAKMMPDSAAPPLLREEALPPAEDKAASALFTTLNTDKWGEAELVLTPPMQGKEWFLSWRAYDGAQQLAASGVEYLDLRLPLSLEYILGEEFLPGDMPELRFRASGTAVAAQETQISYELSLPELDFRYSGEAVADSWCAVMLPPLPEGSYELRLLVSGGGERQECYVPLTVQRPSSAFYALQQQDLQAATRLDIESSSDVTLIFSGPAHAAALADLFALAQRDAVRLDYKLAAQAAANLLRQYGADMGAENSASNLPLYQRDNGGLAPLPRAAASSKISALAAPLITPQIDRAALAAYLRSYYGQVQEPREQALALYGLASLAQPVLLDIDRLAAEQPAADTRLYLALAYMACGNGAAAKALAVDLLALLTATPDSALQQTDTFSDTQAATAYLALLAQIFELPQAGELYADLLSDDTPGYAQTLALAQILAAQGRALPPDAHFSYQLGGVSHQISLSGQSYYNLTLPAQQLAQLTFSQVAGQVKLSAISRQQGWQEAQLFTAQPPSIERSYKQLQAGEPTLTEVRLDIYLPEDAPPGYYRVEDILPAGLRFNALNTEASSRQAAFFAQDGSKLSFDIYKGEGAYHASVIYTARVYTPGLYQAGEPRIFAVRHPLLNAVGETQQVDVK